MSFSASITLKLDPEDEETGEQELERFVREHGRL